MNATVWVVIVVIAAILLVIRAIYQHDKRRTEQFKLVADRMGLLFYPKGDSALMEKLSGFHLFS